MDQRLNKWKKAFQNLLMPYGATEDHFQAINRYLAYLEHKFVNEQGVEVRVALVALVARLEKTFCACVEAWREAQNA